MESTLELANSIRLANLVHTRILTRLNPNSSRAHKLRALLRCDAEIMNFLLVVQEHKGGEQGINTTDKVVFAALFKARRMLESEIWD